MPRARDPNRNKAFEIYKNNNGSIDLVEIASQLNLSPGTIRGWKSKDKWEQQMNGTLQKGTERSERKKGGQPGNKNADGGPPGNKKAEKHGFFSKWLPEETLAIMGSIQSADPLDLLWDNIQLQYTAIIRAQNIMYVKDKEDKTIERIEHGYGETSEKNKWEVQQAWDKQATFLNAQSRAMKTLEGMIKQYDELLHKNWKLATEEQKTRIEVMKSKANLNEGGSIEDDGFIEALQGKVDDIWQEE